MLLEPCVWLSWRDDWSEVQAVGPAGVVLLELSQLLLVLGE